MKSKDTASDSGRCDFGESITADNTDDFGTVGGFFMRSIQTNPMIFMSDRLSVAFSFSRRGALTHHLQSRRWYPSRWSGSCALHELSSDSSPEGAGNAASGIACAVGSMFCFIIKTVVSVLETTRRLPAKTCHRQLLRSYGYRFFCDTHFLFAKKKQKQKRKDGEDKWRSTTWKRKL